MNHINFTYPGKFPATQATLEYMQKCYGDGFFALVGAAGTTPLILTGMAYDDGAGIMDEGYFAYDGEIYYFPGSSFTGSIPVPGSVLVSLVNIPTPAIFQNNLTHDVYFQREGRLSSGTPGTSDLQFVTFRPYHVWLGEKARNAGAAFGTVSAVSVGPGVCGITLNHRKSELTNMLHIWGSVESTTAQSIAAPAANVAFVGLLPAEICPAHKVPFIIPLDYTGVLLTNATGGDLLTGLYATAHANGTVGVRFIRPQSGITSYTADFNLTIPLD